AAHTAAPMARRLIQGVPLRVFIHLPRAKRCATRPAACRARNIDQKGVLLLCAAAGRLTAPLRLVDCARSMAEQSTTRVDVHQPGGTSASVQRACQAAVLTGMTDRRLPLRSSSRSASAV